MSESRELPDRDTFTPHDIAVAAFGEARAFQNAKMVRDWLRATVRRPPELKNTSWLLNREVAQACLDAMTARRVDTIVTLDDIVSDDTE